MADDSSLQVLLGLDPDLVRCPYPAYARLREENGGAPVYVPEIECWIVSRYDDVVRVSRDSANFSSVMYQGHRVVEGRNKAVVSLIAREPELEEKVRDLSSPQRVLIWADPPDHRRHRLLVNRAFTPAKVANMERRVREVANDLVDGFSAKGRVELLSEFCVLLPLTVIAERLGIEDHEFAQFKEYSDEVVRPIGNPHLTDDEQRAVILARLRMRSFFLERIQQRRADPGDDLISDIADAHTDERPLTDFEIVDMLGQILAAGNETTTKLIALSVWTLMRDPELESRVRADRTLIPRLTEEMLRLEPPVQAMYRTATADVEVGGVQIRAGQHVMLSYASANRDEKIFSDPDSLSLSRASGSGHLSFGNGEHFCLGSSLARLEAHVALDVLLDRFASIRPAAGVDLDRIEFERSYILHGPHRLDVECDPVAPSAALAGT